MEPLKGLSVPGTTEELEADLEERSRRTRENAREQARAVRAQARARAQAGKIRSPRSCTIRSDEDGSSESDVPLQVKYTGDFVITSAEALRPCAELGVQGMLDLLNDLLGTTYTLVRPGLRDLLLECIDRSDDFGLAYARLRPDWSFDVATHLTRLAYHKEKHIETRRTALDEANNTIVSPRIPPRRVWDLYSNRVVPTYFIRQEIWAVSHSWMSPPLRTMLWTAINGREWPVPLPNDTTLERVRVELLNLGAQYVWLDVLCLRQEYAGDAEREAVRAEEWRLDVPTIGEVYHQNAMVVHYYSGLGRPFEVGDLASERHWLNRAWTLQEISSNSIVAGITHASPVSLSPGLIPDPDGEYGSSVPDDVKAFYHALSHLSTLSHEVDNIFLLLSVMRRRASTTPVDRIAGLAYLLRSMTLPGYVLGESAEHAWMRLVDTMHMRYRGDLLFLFPSPGDGACVWCPSWRQIESAPLPKTGGVYMFEPVLKLGQYDGKRYRHKGYLLEECLVCVEDPSCGCGVVCACQNPPRAGKFEVNDGDGVRHTFQVVAIHAQPISQGQYALISGQGQEYWIVCKVEDGGRMRKVSVLRMSDHIERKRLNEANNLGRWVEHDFL